MVVALLARVPSSHIHEVHYPNITAHGLARFKVTDVSCSTPRGGASVWSHSPGPRLWGR